MKLIPLLLLIAIGGCAQHERMMACRDEMGPKPAPAAGVLYLFGALGAMAAESIPERAAWNDRVSECVKRKAVEEART